MELKVWCDGIQRVVCGATATTTCQDIVFALAHATGQTGRFILIEKWRNNEKVLAPSDRPLASLAKWGEYSNDVSFVMKRSGDFSYSKTSNKTNSLLAKKSDTDLINKRKDFINTDKKYSENIAIPASKSMSSIEPCHANTLPLRNKSEPFHGSTSFYLNSVDHLQPSSQTNSANNLNEKLKHGNKRSSPICNEPLYSTLSKSRPRQPPPYQEAIAKSTLVNIINTSVMPGNAIYGHTTSTMKNTSSHYGPNSTQPIQSSLIEDNLHNKGLSDPSLVNTDLKRANPISSEHPSPNSKPFSNLRQETINLIDIQQQTMKNQERDMANIEQEISMIQRKLSENEFVVKRYQDEMELLKQLWFEQELLIEKFESQNMDYELEQLICDGKKYEDEMKDIKQKLATNEIEISKCREEICNLMNQIDDAYSFKNINFENSDISSLLEQLRNSIQDKTAKIMSQKSDLEKLNDSIENLDQMMAEKNNLIDQLVIEIKEANVEGLSLQSATLFVEDKAVCSSDQSTPRSTKTIGTNRKIPVSPHELGNTVPTKKNPDGIWV